MRAYIKGDTFYVPGTQPKDAHRITVRTDTQGLVRFLNELVPEASLEAEVPEAPPIERTVLPPIPEPAKITDEAFEALPLAYQLHLGALALENARSRLK